MDFKKKTIIEKKEFLKLKDYKSLFKEVKSLKYKKIYQIRKKHFSHVFKYNNSRWPKANESWEASFSYAINNKKSKSLNKFFYKIIVPYIKKISKNKIKYFLFPNIYRISKGDYFRCHYDQFAGIFGYNLFLSDEWKWDYGGILHFIDKKNIAVPYFPEKNKLLLRNEKKKLLHFVTEVPKYVKQSHYLILGWCSDSSGEASKLRGDYIKL